MDRIEVLKAEYNLLFNKEKRTNDELNKLVKLGKLIELEYAKELNEMFSEFEDRGVLISDAWQLVNSKVDYHNCIDILIKHLKISYNINNKEAIIRSLATKEARGVACKTIIEEYNKFDNKNIKFKWVFGNTMNEIITEEYVDDVIKIVTDKSNSWSRGMFILALGKIKSEKSESVLIDLLYDDEVSLYAIKALAKLKSQKAKSYIIKISNNSKGDIKKEAIKAIKRIKK